MSNKDKWARAALLIAGLALPCVPASAAEVTVSIESVSCAPGGTAVAWIILDNAADVTGADLSLRLPDFAVPGPATTTDSSASFLAASRAQVGQIDMAIASATGLPVAPAVVLGVPFTLRRSAEAGNYPLTFDRLQVYDSVPDPVSSQVVTGMLTVTPPPADRDGDGLPDDWETGFFGGTDSTGEADSDQDGVIDAGEYLAGTDPTRPDSVFAIESLGVEQGNGAVALRWGTQEDRTYEIEWSDDPLGPDMTWHPIYNPQIETDPAGALWIDDGSRTYRLPSASQQRFYRIQASLTE